MSVRHYAPGQHTGGNPYVRHYGPRSLGVDWWLSGGITAANCLAAYKPKGAASLAASYDNNAAPGNGLADGTYDCTAIAAPLWDAATGWSNSNSGWLNSNLIPNPNQTYSMFVRFSDSVGATVVISAAQENAGGNNFRFGIYSVSAGKVVYQNQPLTVASRTVAPELVAGTLGFSGPACYRNGATDGSIAITAAGTNTTRYLYILANNLSGSFQLLGTIKIQYLSIYNTPISAAQQAALTAATA